MAKKCLMIETPDKKRFFTYEKNYTKILEFANSFNYEISTVKLEEGEILDLQNLADAISCQASTTGAKYEIVKIKKSRKYNTKK